MTDEPPEERRTQVADSVDVFYDVWCRHSSKQAVDLTADQHVFASEAGYCAGQAWRGLEEVAIQPVGTLRDVDVFTNVARELHQRNVDALRPALLMGGGGRGQGIFERTHRLAQLRTVPPQVLQKGLVG